MTCTEHKAVSDGRRLDVRQLRALCNRLGVSSVSRGEEGLLMQLDARCVPDPACLLQAISETDGRLVLSARAPARMILKVINSQEQELLLEALKVTRKLTKRIDELIHNSEFIIQN